MFMFVAVKSLILDKELIQRVVRNSFQSESTDDTISWSSLTVTVIDAFLFPKFRYDPIRNIFSE